MWQCECGEFNNEGIDFCGSCKQVKVSKDEQYQPEKQASALESVFRRMQDFVVVDIALSALVALYCFIIGLKEALPIIVLLLFQTLLITGLLRMIYQLAMTSERNSIFISKIHKLLLERESESEDDQNNSSY